MSAGVCGRASDAALGGRRGDRHGRAANRSQRMHESACSNHCVRVPRHDDATRWQWRSWRSTRQTGPSASNGAETPRKCSRRRAATPISFREVAAQLRTVAEAIYASPPCVRRPPPRSARETRLIGVIDWSLKRAGARRRRGLPHVRSQYRMRRVAASGADCESFHGVFVAVLEYGVSSPVSTGGAR